MSRVYWRSSLLVTGSLIASLICTAGTAFAQATDKRDETDAGDSDKPQEPSQQVGLEDIVVTARKREERAQDTPISVLVTTGETLRDSGIQKLEGLTESLPNVTVTEGALGDFIYVRGVGSGQNSGFEQSVGTFIDGIYHGRGLQTRNAFLDVERVEVLRGPQSIFFGQNTVAGALNIATTAPSLREVKGYAEAGYQFGTRTTVVQSAVGGPLSSNLGMRVAGIYSDQEGWQINNSLGKREPREKKIAGRVTALFEPSSTFSAVARVQVESSETFGRAAQAVGCPPPDGQDPAGYCLAYGVIGNGQKPDFTFDNSRNGGNGAGPILPVRDDFNKLDNFGASLSLGLEVMDGLQIASVTGYNKYDDRRSQSGQLLAGPFPTPALPFSNAENVDERYEQFSQELRLTSPRGGMFEYIAGVYYQTSDLRIINDFGAALFATRLSDHQQKEETKSAFASVTWNATARLHLTAGVRYTRVDKSVFRNQILASNQGNLDLSQAVPITPSNPLFGLFTSVFRWKTGTISADRTDDKWIPSLNAKYDIAPDVMVYAGYSEGFKAGGFDEQNGRLDLTSFGFDPEGVKSYEAGFKSTILNNTLRINVTGFYSTFTNVQSLTFDGTLNFLVNNTARSRVRGVEAEIAWQLSDSLRLSTQASYLDAYNVLRPDAQCTTSQIATLLGRRIRTPAPGCAFVNGLQVQDLSGERLPYSPELSGNLILAHEWAMENGWTVDTAAGGNWESSFFVADDLDPFLRQKGYVKFNASVRITTPDRRFELAVIGTNLSDKRTYHSGNDLPLSAGSYYKFLDKPRTVTFQVRTNF